MTDSTQTGLSRLRRRVSSRKTQAARRADLACLAEEVSLTHCPEGRVDPVLIARKKGITYSFGEYGDAFDGMLECRRGRFHIYCNLTRLGGTDSHWARFTMAHELGHYFIDHVRCSSIRSREHFPMRRREVDLGETGLEMLQQFDVQNAFQTGTQSAKRAS